MDAKALLDSLMGNDRNAGKREEKRASWRDNAICKNFLAWECPCDFFMKESGHRHQKCPFGECSKQHSEAMLMRFKEDKDYSRCKHRYLQDLSEQLRKILEPMDKKITADKEALIMKAEAAKDKLEASGKLGADDTYVDNDGRSRKRGEDEICEVCGTYTAFTGAVIMRHEAGLLHVGWGRVRESFVNIQKAVKESKETLTRDDLIGPTALEGRERSKSSDVHKSRDQRQVNRDGRKEVDETRNRDRDRRREYDQKSLGRERDTRSDRERDRDDNRRPDARNRDRGDGGGVPEGRSRKAEHKDELGRSKAVHDEHRDGQHPTSEEDKRAKDNRSRSRDAPRKAICSWTINKQDSKVLQIEFSEDWQEAMNKKCEESQLSMSDWDMTCFDRRGKDPAKVGLSKDSFPLKFKFARKA